MGNPNVAINLGMLITKELNYKGSFRYGVCFLIECRHLLLMTFISLVIILLRSPWWLKAKLI